jgi:3-hydroxy acid dehydrogenase / malonic semialdehyde reductase
LSISLFLYASFEFQVNKKYMKKTALITGATSGIGKAVATELAGQGYRIILTGRRADRLEDLAGELKSKFSTEVLPLCFDVRDRKKVAEVFASLPDNWDKIDVLVNNAGLAAGLDLIQESDIDDWEQMIDTNVKGLLYVSRAVAPKMIKAGSGHIVNISSIAGHQVYEKGHVYCATKHAVEAITQGLRIDLLKHGIKVSAISPGMVETEFSLIRFKGDSEKAANVYKGLIPLTAADVADAIGYMVSRPAHVCINEMFIMPTAQANAYYTHRS